MELPLPLHGGHDHVADAEAIGWSFPIVVVLALTVGALGYMLLWVVMRRRGQSVPIARAISFGCGLLAVGLALFSPIDPVGEQRSLSVHMFQHELLLMVAPLLIICGFEQALTLPISRVVFRPALRSRAGRGVLRVLAGPWIVASLWSAMVLGWHIPAVYDLALRNPVVHITEHAALLTVGLLFWAVISGRLPSIHRTTVKERVTLLGIAMAIGGGLGAVLLWSPALVYQRYASGTPLFGLSPLADQQLAGIAMMAIDMPLLMGAMLLAVGRWARMSSMRYRLEESASQTAPVSANRPERLASDG